MRSWAAVHATVPALSILGLVAPASVVFSQVWVSDVGVARLAVPVSLLMLLPTAAGVAVAVAAHNTARLPLPDPPRAAASRAAWALTWTAAAVLTVNLGQLAGAQVGWEPVARNVLLHAALGLLTVRLGYPHLAWLPSLLYSLACMVFGHPQHGARYYWWAVVMETGTTSGQLITVGALFAVVLSSNVVHAPRTMHGGRVVP